MRKGLLMLVRLCGLAALVVGGAYVAGYGVPLQAHMALGVLTVLAMWGLAATAIRRVPPLAVLAIIVGLLVPVFGVLQVAAPVAGAPWLLPAVHVALGVAAIGFAEALSRRGSGPAL